MCCFKKYIEQTDDKLGYLVEADVRFIKERYENQMKIVLRNYFLAILIFCVIALSLAIVLIVVRIKRIIKERHAVEAELNAAIARYESMYNAALAEIDSLNETFESNTLDENVRTHIVERLELLDKFIASYMTPNFSLDATKELRQLMQDKNHFFESTRISFSMVHPKFVAYMKKQGLSDSEIGYCCLYAMGLKGKDISSYMGNGHYKLSSAIRKKFGLNKHDTNLDIFLREKLAENID